MRIATWNVNSVRVRETLVYDFLKSHEPDLLLLQEIKCEAAQFPAARFQELGYRAEIVGQKAYNGVAVLSRAPVAVRASALPGLPADDAQARFLEVEAGGIIVADLYCPNGNSRGEDGFRYKLAWMEHLRVHAAGLLAADRDFVLAGDYNICPTEADLAPGALGSDDALVRPESRAAWRALLWLGLTDALRAVAPRERLFTYWDYQAGAFDRDIGLRIDHALLSPRLAERLVSVSVARDERAKTQPSDHVPVIVEIS
jgi:exodeoxyribonuclease III